jgi:hypothetical protein
MSEKEPLKKEGEEGEEGKDGETKKKDEKGFFTLLCEGIVFIITVGIYMIYNNFMNPSTFSFSCS